MSEGNTLYISDLDGTLLNSDSELSEHTKNVLNRLIAGGLHFSVATGRATDAAQRILSGVDINIPIASFNGAVLYDLRQNSYVKAFWLAPEATEKIIAILKAHGLSWLVYELKDDGLTAFYDSLEHKPLYDFVEDRRARYHSAFSRLERLSDLSLSHIMYFTLIDKHERIKPACDALKAIPDINFAVADTYNNGYWWLEIFSAEASKENAVRFLREAYGYKRVIGFGDNYNDLPMFRVCDVRVAVQNAPDKIKAAADFVCGSHDAHGVAGWIINNYGKCQH